MKNAVVLNVRERPYAYVVNITANHGIKPDAAAFSDDNVSYDAGARGDENIFANSGQAVSICKYTHYLLLREQGVKSPRPRLLTPGSWLPKQTSCA
jgi:hypothetical protein